MLYLISGASRAGKTIIARKLSAQKGISYFSLDWLIMGFTNGIPAYGIHDKLFPDEIAERSWSFLKAMFENMIWGEVNYYVARRKYQSFTSSTTEPEPEHLRRIQWNGNCWML